MTVKSLLLAVFFLFGGVGAMHGSEATVGEPSEQVRSEDCDNLQSEPCYLFKVTAEEKLTEKTLFYRVVPVHESEKWMDRIHIRFSKQALPSKTDNSIDGGQFSGDMFKIYGGKEPSPIVHDLYWQDGVHDILLRPFEIFVFKKPGYDSEKLIAAIAEVLRKHLLPDGRAIRLE